MADLDLRQLVASTATEDLPALAGRLREAEVLIEIRLRSMVPTTGNDHAEGDRNLSAQEAAHRLGVSKGWLYRRGGTLPFHIRIGRRVLFSARGLDAWTRHRVGR